MKTFFEYGLKGTGVIWLLVGVLSVIVAFSEAETGMGGAEVVGYIGGVALAYGALFLLPGWIFFFLGNKAAK